MKNTRENQVSCFFEIKLVRSFMSFSETCTVLNRL